MFLPSSYCHKTKNLVCCSLSISTKLVWLIPIIVSIDFCLHYLLACNQIICLEELRVKTQSFNKTYSHEWPNYPISFSLCSSRRIYKSTHQVKIISTWPTAYKNFQMYMWGWCEWMNVCMFTQISMDINLHLFNTFILIMNTSQSRESYISMDSHIQ